MPRLFITFILFLGIFVVSAFYLRPEWNTFKIIRQQNEALVQQSGDLDQLIKQRDDFLARINTISKDDLARLEQALPRGPETASFLVSIERLIKENGLTLKQLDSAGTSDVITSSGASKTQPKPGGVSVALSAASTGELPINLAFSGAYDSVKQFMDSLEQTLRLIDVETFSITPRAQAHGQPLFFDVAMKIKTYFQ